MSKFLDHARIEVQSGDGGNGAIAWRREKYEPMGGPAGGNGGRGGSVIVETTEDLNTLIEFRYKSKFIAQNGERGGPKRRDGKAGQDLILRVPVGTVIKDVRKNLVIADLSANGQRLLVARGGMGGRGNGVLASSTNRTPYYCEPGEPGVNRILALELKVLADVGIIGLPNAGKSTLLSVMTRAKPKIADYPFSTLEPNLGVVKGTYDYVMADIPGLVEGASLGVGLGHQFLRHIERTRLLVHLVDINSEKIFEDISTIARELELYSKHLSTLPQILVLNKIDLLDAKEIETIEKKVRGFVEEGALKNKIQSVSSISAAAHKGIEQLDKLIAQNLQKLTVQTEKISEEIIEDPLASEPGDRSFAIERKGDSFIVRGDRVERLTQVTDIRSPESVHHLYHLLRVMGVVDALLKEGASPGHEVIIGETCFVYGEGFS